jgi:hypothetical protein
MLTPKKFKALKREAEIWKDYHPYDGDLRLLEHDAAGNITGVWHPFDASDMPIGTKVMVSEAPLFWAATNEGTETESMGELSDVRKHSTFIACLPNKAGHLESWAAMSKNEVIETWKVWKL